MIDSKAKQLIILSLLLLLPLMLALNLPEDLLTSAYSPVKIFFVVLLVVFLIFIIKKFVKFYEVVDFESSPKTVRKEEQKKVKSEDLALPDKKSSFKEVIERKMLNTKEILIILSLLFVLLTLQLLAL